VTFCARGLQEFGTEEQKRQYLPEVAAGRLRFAMGLSEPDAGSDLTGLSTRAVRDGSDFVVSGQKIFTTGADTAAYIFAFVRTNPEASSRHGLSVVLIPRDAPGVTVRTLRKLSGQATHTCEVFLDEVRVPDEALVGEEGNGVAMIFGLLDGERIQLGANGCGIAQGALDLALRHAVDRRQFDQPIVSFQAVGHPLADMAMEIQAARLMVRRPPPTAPPRACKSSGATRTWSNTAWSASTGRPSSPRSWAAPTRFSATSSCGRCRRVCRRHDNAFSGSLAASRPAM
jgi:alkylation response protein AidB-like acyl-CoA dehydrogenase